MSLANPVMMSSKDDDWETPDEFFELCAKLYGPFDLDAAATKETAKVEENFISPEEDAFTVAWHERCSETGNIWLNPPYGKGMDRWCAKAIEEAEHGCRVTMLAFARTDTLWWHDYVLPSAAIVSFVRGRLKFNKPGEVSADAAPAPSALIVFMSEAERDKLRKEELKTRLDARLDGQRFWPSMVPIIFAVNRKLDGGEE